MQRYFATIEGLEDIGDILRYSSQVCLDQGALRHSYHLTPQFDAQVSDRVAVFAHGFSDAWLARYERSDFRKKDPIPDRVMRHGALLTWADARDAAPNTPDNENYFKAMDEEGLVHGFGLPLFGPRSRDAYAGFDFGRPISEISNEALGVVRSVPQAAHQRVCILLESRDEVPVLSERETQVMQWIVRGKSLGMIADILEISPDTVKTYSKRIYAKLDCSDRVGATVAALKFGLVNV
ncbi:MAG: LuxR C-terminal-related transcriptional regulator [Pseudomonadota bacterium]